MPRRSAVGADRGGRAAAQRSMFNVYSLAALALGCVSALLLSRQWSLWPELQRFLTGEVGADGYPSESRVVPCVSHGGVRLYFALVCSGTLSDFKAFLGQITMRKVHL